MPAAKAAECHALTTYYIKKYKEKYGIAPVVNRNVAKIQFENMLMDYNSEEIRNLIDFFFTTESSNSHKISTLFYGYDKLVDAMRLHDQDVAFREKLKEETKRRAEEWRASGKKGIG